MSDTRGGAGRRGLGALAAVGLLVVGSGACSGDDDSSTPDDEETRSGDEVAGLLGPEDAAAGEPVLLGMISDGATQAYDNTDELRAAQAAADLWNEHRGGVAGRPIEVVTCETGGEPAGGTDCANRMVESGVVAVALSQSAVADAVWEPLHEAGVPTMFLQTSATELLADDRSSFTMANPLSTLFSVPIALAEDEGSDRIAFVNIDVPQANESFESGAADEVLTNAGLDYDLIRIPPGTADMVAQLQQVADSDAGVVYIVGNDAFCIAAIQALEAVAYDGVISSVAQCITDATREALPDRLEGISITATMAVGDTEDTAYQRYQAVMGTFGDDVEDVDNPLAMGGYTVMASLAASLVELEGEVTPETVAAAIKSMPETDFPGADGVRFRCGGSAFPSQPAVCSRQSLRAVLDADGNPASYEATDASALAPG